MFKTYSNKQNYFADLEKNYHVKKFSNLDDVKELIKFFKDRYADATLISSHKLIKLICPNIQNYLYNINNNLYDELLNRSIELYNNILNEIMIRDWEQKKFLENGVNVDNRHLNFRNNLAQNAAHIKKFSDKLAQNVAINIQFDDLLNFYDHVTNIFNRYKNSSHLTYDPEVKRIKNIISDTFRKCEFNKIYELILTIDDSNSVEKTRQIINHIEPIIQRLNRKNMLNNNVELRNSLDFLSGIKNNFEIYIMYERIIMEDIWLLEEFLREAEKVPEGREFSFYNKYYKF